jgi:hypothetical protein
MVFLNLVLRMEPSKQLLIIVMDSTLLLLDAFSIVIEVYIFT